jgi:DNA-binding HxlR family transcriptional regulator
MARRLTTCEVLRLLSAGATGGILMALGDGELRTKELTERVRGYAPRTIYRYASKLAELGVIEREEEPGVPSKVVHRLTDSSGRDLYRLVDAYATASLNRLPSGEVGAHSWRSLALLADLWESGMVGQLDFGPRTATELAREGSDLSYHQVSRRATMFAVGGFVRALPDVGRRRRYELTEKARRAMVLIAGIGRWRRRHVVPEGTPGLSAAEAAGVLRTALPLVVLPEHAGKRLKMGILAPEHVRGDDGELVWAVVEPDGAVVSSASPAAEVDGWGCGRVESWIDSILDGPHNDLHLGGDKSLIKSCLANLHTTLWRRREGED